MTNRFFSNHRQFDPVHRKICLCCRLIFNLAVFSTLLNVSSVLGGEDSKSVLSVQELKELAPKIESAERKPRNIKIESEAWVETKTDFYDPCQTWQKTPIYHSQTVWVDGGPEGKERVDVHKEVNKWINGISPYGEESYSMSYYGQHGRYIQAKKGEILPDRPNRLGHGGYDSGIHWSLPFFNGEIYKFSKMFELASDPNSEAASELEFTIEEFEGTECIKIWSRLYDVTYWLDLSHGFALRGRKSIAKYPDGHEELIELVKVTKLKEVAPSAWWPMEIISISRPYTAGEPWRKYIYRASSVIANDLNYNESIFTPAFPKGYTVEDKITGKTYVVDTNSN
jgi:hypothetical protein